MNMFKNDMFVFIILFTILSTTVGLLKMCSIDKIEVNQYKTAKKINKIREQKTNILRCNKIM